MTRFLYRVLRESGQFEAAVIVAATSSRDSASVAVKSPTTWLGGPRVIEGVDRGLPYTHVGAWVTELEFQRYRPRRALDEILEQFDILQFVTGAAPWAEVARHVHKPKCLWVATTIKGDRSTRAKAGSFARNLWSNMMMSVAEIYERRALKSADSVLALSPYTARSIARVLNKANDIPLAFCGVDTDLFAPRVTGPGRAENKPYILCVARLFDARKNVMMLLRAYASLACGRDDMPELRLVGEPLSDDAFKLLERLGIGDRVILTGPTHGEDLAALYRDAMFFVLPSDEEGLGIVILEAMASGIAVISTACGGPEVAVDDGITGLLTPVRDQEALAEAMTRLIGDEQLRTRFGAAGREKAEKQFSLAASADVFLRQYERLLPDSVSTPVGELV